MQRHTGNGQFSDRLFPCSILRFVPILPYIPPIKGCKKIIDIYAEIGIQADSIVNKNINCRHHNTCQPQINTRPIF